MSYDILFKKIVINGTSSKSGVFVGENSVPLWKVYSKTQVAIDVPRNTFISNSKFYISDMDIVDFYAVGREQQ